MTQQSVKTITPEEVEERRRVDPDLLLLDVREPEEWEVHHIPGAVLIPMRSMRTHLPELNPDRETIVICEHGLRSQQVAQFLVAQARFQNVSSMAGGMSTWTGPIETGE